jgi:lambda family phage portal protein
MGGSYLNWLDQVIGYVSPETGYKREAYRKALGEMRNYDAAGYDRLNSNWRVFNESAEMTDRYGRDVVRARARDLERNSDIMNAVTGAYKRNVFGAGYRLRANSGIDTIDHEIERFWKTWCKKQNCDVTGTQNFNAMMRMAIQRKKVDGGILFLKRYTSGGFLPFKLQSLEVDELDMTRTTPRIQGNKVVGGIEYNSYNSPVGYFINQYSVDGMSMVEPVYIDAKEVIFLYTKTRPSQIREISDMKPTITRIRDANEFMRAVSVKERILACFSVFIERALPTSGTTPGRGMGSDSTDAKYDGKTLTPGMIHYLNQGDKAQAVVPSGQATDATAYIKQEIRLVGAGQGLSYETTSRDMSESNYSSARQGLIEDDLTYGEDKDLLIELMDEIYETFVISLVLTEKINFKEFWKKKEDYLDHNWIQAPKRWIDPVKEANSNKIALNTGQKTWADIASENGKDWKEQVDQIAEIMEYGESKGIDMGGVIFGNGGKTGTSTGAGTKEANGNSGKSK